MRRMTALLLLAAPFLFSGCTTCYLWEKETVIVAERREGPVHFVGDRREFVRNPSGDLAYPGRMTFAEDGREDIVRVGWLIIPAKVAAEWKAKTDGKYAVKINRKPGWGDLGSESSRPHFAPAKGFAFVPAGADPQTPPTGFIPSENRPASEEPDSHEETSLTVHFDPLVRTGTSENLDTLSKVALTPPAITADAATIAAAPVAYILVGTAFILGSL